MTRLRRRAERALAGVVVALGCSGTAPADAAGKLNLYSWGDYTSPELVERFERVHDVDLIITDFDGNDTALAKVSAGGHGFDLAVVASNFLPIWIEQGLVLESRPDRLPNFRHVEPRWIEVPFDPGRHFSVPWTWGVTGVIVDGAVYPGEADSWGAVLEPPPELAGRINVVPEANEVVAAAVMYLGGEPCTEDRDLLRRVRDLLLAAKTSWRSMDFVTKDGYASGDFAAGVLWNGDALRARLDNPALRFGFPREGFPLFMDNMVVLKDAENVDNAMLFLDFIMDPANAARITAYNRFANGIAGSDAFLPTELRDAPELALPDGHQGIFLPRCAPQAAEYVTRIWTELQK